MLPPHRRMKELDTVQMNDMLKGGIGPSQFYASMTNQAGGYERNKYHCPLVVFSGVNNHNNNVILVGAIVANEKEETCVWVLEQFLEAMLGKSPICYEKVLV